MVIFENMTADLKRNTESVHRFDEGDHHYGILIIDRGEALFFQEDERALICEVSARFSLINPLTIKRWDDGTKIDDTERQQLVDTIILFYQKAYKTPLKVYKP